MDMMNLPDDIQEEFMSGKFAIKQTAGVFNGQWSDSATDKTIIKDLKGSGGIISTQFRSESSTSFFCMQTCRNVNKIFRACFNIEWVSHVVLDMVYYTAHVFFVAFHSC
jgi:hypothetical protein